MTIGISAYGAYIPAYRLPLSQLATAGTGSRIVAGFDEDSTTMAVEACRSALSTPGAQPQRLYLATTSPAYVDKTNATAVHAALALDRGVLATDFAASARSGAGAMLTAAITGGLVAMADVRVGRPSSADERSGADAAAAFLWDDRPSIATLASQASVSAEFLDRWSLPGETGGTQWEERFGLEQYLPLLKEAAAAALDRAGIEQADHVILVSPNSGVTKRAATAIPGRLTTGGSPIGHAGAADVGVALADLLDSAGAGESILVVSAADGADAFVLVTTDLLLERRQPVPVRLQLAGGLEVSYPRYLGWRGIVEHEPPRRPDPARPAAPPSARSGPWKYGLEGTRCTVCGFVHLPPVRVCKHCGAVDSMQTVSLAGERSEGTIATFTVDRLAFSPSPPVVQTVIDFDGGGRFTFELADPEIDRLAVGARVGLTFRRLYTAEGVHNYFWKARMPMRNATETRG
jgi:hydroxymethylglutaryl-CoA synthase